MSLDILTHKGQQSVEQEQDAIAIWHHHYPTLRYCETPKGKPAAVDAVLVNKSGIVVGVVETKCREMTMDDFNTRYKAQWLVTFAKMLHAIEVAEALQVKMMGFLYLVPDRVLLCKTLWSPDGGYLVDFTVSKTETQKTINGGLIKRDNAFIDMGVSQCLRM